MGKLCRTTFITAGCIRRTPVRIRDPLRQLVGGSSSLSWIMMNFKSEDYLCLHLISVLSNHRSVPYTPSIDGLWTLKVQLEPPTISRFCNSFLLVSSDSTWLVNFLLEVTSR